MKSPGNSHIRAKQAAQIEEALNELLAAIRRVDGILQDAVEPEELREGCPTLHGQLTVATPMSHLLEEGSRDHFPKPPATPEELEAFEQRVGWRLDLDLRAFYLHSDSMAGFAL